MNPVSTGSGARPGRSSRTVWVCPPSRSAPSNRCTSCWRSSSHAVASPAMPEPMTPMRTARSCVWGVVDRTVVRCSAPGGWRDGRTCMACTHSRTAWTYGGCMHNDQLSATAPATGTSGTARADLRRRLPGSRGRPGGPRAGRRTDRARDGRLTPTSCAGCGPATAPTWSCSTSACPRASRPRASTSPSSCAPRTRTSGSWCSPSTTTRSTRSSSSPTAPRAWPTC